MHLIYIDESGNTGRNLADKQQPIFVLGALIVPELCWQALDDDLERILVTKLPSFSNAESEVHAADLRSGRGPFRSVSVTERLEFRDAWLALAQKYDLKFVYRAISKKKFHDWSLSKYGPSIAINPHVFAFPLIARVVDEYLCSLPNQQLGMFISDENKEIVRDIEKSIKVLRGTEGILRLTRIVEKGFFIDSSKSRPLQLCDLLTMSCRKMEEQKHGFAIKQTDESAFEFLKPVIHRGKEDFFDVLKWFTMHLEDGA